VRISLADTGTGMTAEVQARAFDPFYTTKPRGAGTGLGLATTYGIVVRSGGDIAIRSAPGSGTTIEIHFPLAHDVSASTAARATRRSEVPSRAPSTPYA
jgi:signal transduction histidine kinase